MSYLIDTCALSELVRSKPDANVTAWFASVPQGTLHISVLTLGEIRKGAMAVTGRRQSAILQWLEHDLPAWFGARLLPIDTAVADEWGRLLAASKRSLPAIDSLIAATAICHRLTIVTRNTKDFNFAGVQVLNPWEG